MAKRPADHHFLIVAVGAVTVGHCYQDNRYGSSQDIRHLQTVDQQPAVVVAAVELDSQPAVVVAAGELDSQPAAVVAAVEPDSQPVDNLDILQWCLLEVVAHSHPVAAEDIQSVVVVHMVVAEGNHHRSRLEMVVVGQAVVNKVVAGSLPAVQCCHRGQGTVAVLRLRR